VNRAATPAPAMQKLFARPFSLIAGKNSSPPKSPCPSAGVEEKPFFLRGRSRRVRAFSSDNGLLNVSPTGALFFEKGSVLLFGC